MIHYVFAWQVAALLMGVALVPLLIARMRSEGRAFPASFLASNLVMILRTLLFSVIHYDKSAHLGIFPYGFEDSCVAGLLYIALVSAAAWLLLAGFFRMTRSRGLSILALPYWAYVLLVIAVYSLIIANVDLPPLLRPFYLFWNIAILPFVATRGLVILACLCLILRCFAGRRGLPLAAAIALAALSQGADIAVRLNESSWPLALGLPLIYLCYFGSLFILAFTGRDAGAFAGGQSEAGGLSGRWSREACLDDGETALLDLLLAGRSNKEIAYALGLGLSAEKHRVQKLFRKLGVGTRNELLSRAAERALLGR